MNNKEQADQIICSHGITDYKWLVPRNDIIVANWVRFRCQFGCSNYGKAGSCPPAVPPIEECQKMLCEYNNAVIIHFPMEAPSREDKINLMSELLDLEHKIFLAGFYKTFLLQHADCVFCKTCIAEGSREKCANKVKCRPSTDAMGIDVFQTARNAGYTIQVLKEHTEIQNRFAILLID